MGILASDLFSTRKVGKILEKMANLYITNLLLFSFFLQFNFFKNEMLILQSNLIILGIFGLIFITSNPFSVYFQGFLGFLVTKFREIK